jgi:hypothetical protein
MMHKRLVMAGFLMIIMVNVFWIMQVGEMKPQLSTFVTFFDFIFDSSSTVAELYVQVVISPPTITIDRPQNTTYFFNVSQTFTIPINVSADKAVQTWWYKLYNATGGLIYNDITFTPNTTIVGVLGSNTLTVYANLSTGQTGSANRTFTIRISNSAPEITLQSSILVCEETFLSHLFNITDADEETITLSMTPLNPFFISKISQTGNRTVGEIFSGTLTKSEVRTYLQNVSASDGTRAASTTTNITVVPINHAPSIERIGTQTIFFNEQFYKQVTANDTEDGNVTGRNLTYNITFISGSTITTINTTSGVINFTSNSSIVGTYNITVCARDLGLNLTIYPNASYCGYTQAGHNCSNFQLAIVNTNRAPNITSYYPTSLAIGGAAPVSYTFNISANDPDGTTPSTYWYVDGSLQLSLSDWFNHTFSTGGRINVTAIASDGELNDSNTWIFNLDNPTSSSGGGGGGGGGGSGRCEERWACDNTASCQDLEGLYENKLLDDASKGLAEIKCRFLGWGEKECGIKIIDCKDLNKCGSINKRPNLTESCYYVSNPSCNDGVKNCHSNSCEVLVDCGGPCGACPTCSDGKQNQLEEGVDCGGPCPTACAQEKPRKKNYFAYILIILILALISAIIVMVGRMRKIKKNIEQAQQ